MTIRRAVTYGGLSCLLAAWLASAASTLRQPAPREPERSMAGASTDTIVADVQEHTTRLRERLASVPTPQLPRRNPFLFATRAVEIPSQTGRRVQPAIVLPPEPPGLPEPALSLIGIAESQSAKGPVRTAMIASETDDLLMVVVGETVLGRYRVEAIGADAVELKETATGTIRRLALR